MIPLSHLTFSLPVVENPAAAPAVDVSKLEAEGIIADGNGAFECCCCSFYITGIDNVMVRCLTSISRMYLFLHSILLLVETDSNCNQVERSWILDAGPFGNTSTHRDEELARQYGETSQNPTFGQATLKYQQSCR